MEVIKLSFIVPIYGVEQYLHKCVDSLLAQDLSTSEYEIILVDDGSPDTCPQICDDYAAAHKNIHVVHRENGGLSAARNSGIQVAKGKYVCFVDSDDYWEPNVLKGLMEQIDRDQLDVLRFNFQNINEKGESFYPYKDSKRDVDYSSEVTNGEIFLNKKLGPLCYAVMFIVRREIQEDCIFKEGVYFEDVDWTPRMLLKAKRVASTPMIVYNYLWREGSITLPDNTQKLKKVIEDKIALIQGFKEQSKIVSDISWFTWMTSFNVMTILGLFTSMPTKERKPYLQKLKSLQIFPLSMYREKVFSHKLKIMLANINPTFYCKLMSIRK